MPRITPENRTKVRSRPEAGYSILAAAKVTGIPETRIRKAIDLGELKVVSWGGVVRIPASEVEKIGKLYIDAAE